MPESPAVDTIITDMDLHVQPGKYVVAVSGGVDSMVLLNLLSGKSGLELTVAHFDHGIRADSAEDRKLVQKVAAEHGLPFRYGEGKLGCDASEAEARAARYGFLENIRQQQGAQAIITAHHQDDLIETMILNILRGTGRKGLSALGDRPAILRPLLCTPKAELTQYARQHHLEWREDSTNADDRYARNYIRHQLMPRLDVGAKAKLLRIATETRRTNAELDSVLAELLLPMAAGQLDRRVFIQLPHAVSRELLAAWLRSNGIAQFDAPLIERVTVAAKTQAPGAIINLIGGANLRVAKYSLALEQVER